MDKALVPILAASIGALAALSGIFIKAILDKRMEIRKAKRESDSIFLSERKAAYDEFLKLVRRNFSYGEELRKLTLTVRDGGTSPPVAELERDLVSPMQGLVESLEQVRRLARTYNVIKAAEGIVKLFGDTAAANRSLLNAIAPTEGRRIQLSEEVKQQDDILWFLLCRLIEDREREFIFAYRTELGIGNPAGGPTRYPLQSRPWPTPEVPEHILRRHILPRHPMQDPAPEDGPAARNDSDSSS